MDAFFVSVELLRRPELRGRPVVVGGSGRRGVVAAASYEARRFGVYSAMPSAIAKRRCPHAVFLRGDHALYSVTSGRVHAIFDRYTALVEPLSLDEAFLDVTGALNRRRAASSLAQRIRDDIEAELSLSCSVGVAPNKFLAKLASVEAKPTVTDRAVLPGRGVVVVDPGGESQFLDPLDVTRMWGVGPVTLERLHTIGVRTIGDLAAAHPSRLAAVLGRRQAQDLAELANGRDRRPVETQRVPRSISHEETFAEDLYDDAEIRRQVVRLSDGVAARLRAAGFAARTVTLKARYGDFTAITRSVTAPEPVCTTDEILALLSPLLDGLGRSKGLRLLGVVGSKLGEPHRQLSFDDVDVDVDHQQDRDPGRTAAAVDAIRSRFGVASIGPASTLDADGVRPIRAGSQQWGPEASEDPRRVEDPAETCETERRAEE